MDASEIRKLFGHWSSVSVGIQVKATKSCILTNPEENNQFTTGVGAKVAYPWFTRMRLPLIFLEALLLS